MRRASLHRAWPLAALLVLLVCMPAPAQATTRIQLTLQTTPDVSMADTVGSLSVTVRNVGTEGVYNMQVDVTALDEGLVLEQDHVEIGTLGPDGMATVQAPFRVPADLPPGYYHVRVVAQGSWNTGFVSATQDATVTVRSPATLLVRSVTPDHVLPGQDTAANITVANVGSAVLSNVVGRWTSAGDVLFPLGGSNEFQISSMQPHSEVRIPVHLTSVSNAAPGPYALSFRVTYNDLTGYTFDTTSTVGVAIAGRPGLSVGVQEVDGETITLAVANIGLNAVTGVQVRLVPQQGFTVTDADTLALGNLAVGAFATAAFDVRLAGDGPPVARVETDYTDSFGERHTQASVLPLNDVAPDTALSRPALVGLTVGAVLLAEALLAGPVLVRRRRARLRERESEEAELFDLDAHDGDPGIDVSGDGPGGATDPASAAGPSKRPAGRRPRGRGPAHEPDQAGNDRGP